MRTENIGKQNWEKYKDMIPHEYDRGVIVGKYHALGVTMNDRAVGAILWEDPMEGDYGALLSLYVLPEARRLGAGTELMRSMLTMTREKKIPGLEFHYVEEGDRIALSPFFRKFRVPMEKETCPLGRVSLNDAMDVLMDRGLRSKDAGGVNIRSILREEHGMVDAFIHEHIHEHLEDYLVDGNGGFFIIKEGKVDGAILYSTEYEDLINISFVYAKRGNEARLMELLASLYRELGRTMGPDTVCEMLLINEDSRKLYRTLFGKSDYEVKVVHGAMM